MRDARGLVEVSMLVEDAGVLKPTREYAHNGTTYVEGLDGRRYALRVQNLTSSRIEVVPSVDGLDVQSGKDAGFSHRGMVLRANEKYDFEGFRLSDKDVATFRFGGVADSYAAQMGKPRNIGVIGVAVFEELFVPPPPPAARAPAAQPMPPGAPPRQGGAPAGGARPPAPAPQSLGTEFGERRESKVSSTKFTRASDTPAAVLSLRYEHREALLALGIRIDDLAERETANPFPAESFAKPPPGWRG